jgi:hypothetical protein
MTDKKITKNLMKNISEMNHDEKRELLKKIEENRLEQIKKVKETLENLNNNPKEYEENECIKYNIMAIKNNRNFCACGVQFKRYKGINHYKCGKSHCNVYGLNK